MEIEKLLNYIKENKKICWDFENCNECCNFKEKNCGKKIRDIIDKIQNKELIAKLE